SPPNTSACSFTVTVVDSTAPVLACPGPIVAECTSSGGASVSFVATASDACDPSPTVVCAPASGSTFAFGVSTVTCTATDHASPANASSCSFSVTVVDTTPPSITCPANVVAECTSSSGAAVSFVATASDACDASPTLSCSPPSGSTFAFGVTTVTCTAA